MHWHKLPCLYISISMADVSAMYIWNAWPYGLCALHVQHLYTPMQSYLLAPSQHMQRRRWLQWH